MQLRKGAARPALFNQAIKTPLLPLDRTHCAIGNLRIGGSIQRYTYRKAAVVFPNDLDAADRFTPRPMPNGVKTLLSQCSVV